MANGSAQPQYAPVASRRRGLTSKGHRTRQRIVDAAAMLISEHGAADTTVEQVRDAAGVSSSQIYHYFADKQALIRAVIDHHAETIVGAQQPLFARFDTLEGLRDWRDFIVGHQRELQCRGGCPLGSLGVEIAETDDRARARAAAGFTRWEDGIRGGLRAMYDAGRLGPDADPDGLAVTLLAALQGGLMLTQMNREIRPLELALDGALSLIESRMAQEPAAPGPTLAVTGQAGV